MICENDGRLTLNSAEDHALEVRECATCESVFCRLCREAISASGSKDRCPLCHSYVGDSQSCRLVGGCGK